MLPLFAIGPEPLDAGALAAAVVARHETTARTAGRPSPGAVSTFLGLVRDQHEGRRVERLEYEAFDALALRSFERIAAEASQAWPEVVLGIHHRTGAVAIGEASVVVVAASAHRAEACGASRYGIERIKQISPIWKREYFAGGHVWVEGATADPDDTEARAEALARSCR